MGVRAHAYLQDPVIPLGMKRLLRVEDQVGFRVQGLGLYTGEPWKKRMENELVTVVLCGFEGIVIYSYPYSGPRFVVQVRHMLFQADLHRILVCV